MKGFPFIRHTPLVTSGSGSHGGKTTGLKFSLDTPVTSSGPSPMGLLCVSGVYTKKKY